MNKIVMKNVFKSLGLPITEYLVFDKNSYDANKAKSLGFPVIVKPANLGSSIGISKIEKEEDLQDAVELAFHYDQNIIIEVCVQNLTELNCAVSEKNGEVITSLVEQPVATSEFLSFEEKYVSTEGGTMQGVKNRVKIPAEISNELTKQIQEYSKIIYREFFCHGGAPRIDYLFDNKNQKLYVNEINTIP
jgi:D-alanine-D-alanine ligase